MSEMAIRIADGREVKIGTCNEMFYCRYDQLDQISYEYMTDGLMWRIPIPEEDHIKPGDFDYPIVRDSSVPWHMKIDMEKIELEDKSLMLRNPGTHQMFDGKMGLLATLKCYHGLKLPENNDDVQFCWNGKNNPLYLSFLENGKDQMYVCVSCRCCRKTWGFSFNEIGDAISSFWMKLRLWHACTDYWFKCIDKKWEDKPSQLALIGKANREYRLTMTEEGEYLLIRVFRQPQGKTLIEARGSWSEVRNRLLSLLENKGEVWEMRNRYLENNTTAL